MAKKEFKTGVDLLIQRTEKKEENLQVSYSSSEPKKTSFKIDDDLLQKMKIWIIKEKTNMDRFLNECMDKALSNPEFSKLASDIKKTCEENKNVGSGNLKLKTFLTNDKKLDDFKLLLLKNDDLSMKDYFIYCINQVLTNK